MPDPMTQVAEAIAGAGPDGDVQPSTTLRIANVTALETLPGTRVQTDATGTTWLNRDADTLVTVGDKVWILQQGGVWLVCGRLAGGVGTPVGVVNAFAGSTAPPGWLICNGQAVSRTTYAALYAVIADTYGAGDGSTTFNVPNLSNRLPMGSGGTFPRGSSGGAQSVTLSTNEMPSHNHGSVGDHTHGTAGSHTHSSDGDHSHSIPKAAGETGAASASDKVVANATGGSTGGVGGHTHGSGGSHAHASDGGHTHTSQGGGNAFSIVPPYTAIPYIIRAL